MPQKAWCNCIFGTGCCIGRAQTLFPVDSSFGGLKGSLPCDDCGAVKYLIVVTPSFKLTFYSRYVTVGALSHTIFCGGISCKSTRGRPAREPSRRRPGNFGRLTARTTLLAAFRGVLLLPRAKIRTLTMRFLCVASPHQPYEIPNSCLRVALRAHPARLPRYSRTGRGRYQASDVARRIS